MALDVESNYLRTIDLVPGLAERVRAGRREERIMGSGDLPNLFRQASGPGWALVGDSGHHMDPVLAHGINDAFRDAESCVAALDQSFSGGRSFDAAMADYQSMRDEHVLPFYEFTAQLASQEPPPPEMQQLLGAMRGNQTAMDGFARVNAGCWGVVQREAVLRRQ